LEGVRTPLNDVQGGPVNTQPPKSKESLVITVLLLIVSNTFMTLAWYGHLKYRNTPIITAILASWLIALAEYCFQVPANRIGYRHFSGYQLKIIQEIITLSVFAVFAYFYLGECPSWNIVLSFICIVGAVVFAFWGKL
jgi:uncharacterized protein (DUF486 family)